MKKFNIKLLFLIFLFSFLNLNAKDLIESQPEILFKYDKLNKSYTNLTQQVAFNKAVLLLQKKKYQEAISIFKTTAVVMKIPSFLNIAIAYYQMDSIYNAKIYFQRIYEHDEARYSNTYSFMSACFYLYQLSKDKNYLEEIINIAKKEKKLSEHSKRMIADTYIVLKNYKAALKVLEAMDYSRPLKKALLHVKLKNYKEADRFLQNAKDNTFNPKKVNDILWFMIFRDLKANDISKLLEHLDELSPRISYFSSNKELPLKIFFNKDKYSAKQYLDFVTKFDDDRVMDYIFYFAPFIFSDSQELIYDLSKGFIFNSDENIEQLDVMLDYNANLLNLIKKDPIIRVKELEKLIKIDTKSYIYYNLGLAYAHIYDFHSAFKYFQKAYKLNPGNKLFSVMTLISSEKISKKLNDREYIEKNIKSNNGLYKYFGHKLYSMFLNPSFKSSTEVGKYKKSIFYKSLIFLNKFQAGTATSDEPLLKEYYKDPFIYLIKLSMRKENESDYSYFSRLQDTIPLKINNNFLDGPLLITQYYIDILKAIGLFYKADLNIVGYHSPSYLRTKALRDLHNDNPKAAVSILEFLQEKYDLEDKYTMYLIVAGLLEDKRYNEASVQISLIKAILKDSGADFLSGVQLIQDLKIHSAKEYFKEPYFDSLIDFKLLGFDDFLESL